MDEPKNIGSAVVTVDCDTSAALAKLDELAERAREVGSLLAPESPAEPGPVNVTQIVRKVLLSIGEKAEATPAELDFLARVAGY